MTKAQALENVRRATNALALNQPHFVGFDLEAFRAANAVLAEAQLMAGYAGATDPEIHLASAWICDPALQNASEWNGSSL